MRSGGSVVRFLPFLASRVRQLMSAHENGEQQFGASDMGAEQPLVAQVFDIRFVRRVVVMLTADDQQITACDLALSVRR